MMYLNGSTHTHTHVEKIIRLVSARLHSNEPVLKGRRMTAKFQKPGASKGDHLSRWDVCPRDKNVINFVPAEARGKKTTKHRVDCVVSTDRFWRVALATLTTSASCRPQTSKAKPSSLGTHLLQQLSWVSPRTARGQP